MKVQKMFLVFVTAGILLATSCSNDELAVLSDNQAQVIFSFSLENRMNTRAISDGGGVNKLIYAVFDSEGNRVAESDVFATFPLEKTLSLIKGEQYTAVFWAQNKDCKAYSISEDYETITVSYEDALNNDESRDAFFKATTFSVTDGAKINVVLKRPFAQLNLAITEEEWMNAKNAGFEVASSSVEIRQAATTLNLVDGSVGGATDVIFKTNTIPANENLKVDFNCDGTLESYKYLSMCYFLANDAVDGASQTILDGLKFTLTSADGSETFELQDGLANAPVQRNYRTNIVSFGENGGNLLTDNIKINISLNPLYDGEHTLTGENIWEKYAGIYTEEALAGKTIELYEDWYIRNGYIFEDMPEHWTLESSPLYTKSYTIDGLGNKVCFEPYEYTFVTKNAFAAADSQPVTVKNITFAGEHFGVYGGVYGGIKGRNNYITNFENVKIIENGIYCYNSAGNIPMSAFSNLGTATLTNCIIKGTYWVGEKDLNTNAQTCYDNFGIYDVFVPNNTLTDIINSTIGCINVSNHGQLKISGTSSINKIDAEALVKGTITIGDGAAVALLNVNEFTASYAPIVNIKAGATVDTLQLNSITKTNQITIEEGANVAKIIYKGVEYTSIEDFKASL